MRVTRVQYDPDTMSCHVVLSLSTAGYTTDVEHVFMAPCVADADIIFSSCGFFFFFFFLLLFSSPNLRRRILDVYHTSTHDLALGRI